ncbi:SDR family NAD(P)-dependent oxidoreductase [Parvicella tangerina]|uniref:3-oxoacyl-[acyl-carrier-protein] reductase FabG n=1 Tax=Parvicella tangerina TaxID=2829795 RepID=A0A916NQI8_9FLAO|nr:SDR family oxidoreductase [Parvicella tangerina]CAG5079143.1 3-oxoacyl-[acyl-carrier-protein] reductase FabG [Parvicella tangerina]
MIDFLDISGKHFLITGATGGIGSSCAKLLSKHGAKLTLTGRNEEKLKELASNCNSEVTIITADLTSPDDLKAIAGDIENVDGFVHCAGIVKPMPIKFIQEKHYHKVFDINYKSAVLLTGQLLKQKKVNKESSMIFLSSISSKFPYLGGALYVSSKAALEAFTKTLAIEHSNLLRANIISPALVQTPIFEETKRATGEDEMNKYEEQYLLGFGQPEDVSNACAFLLSGKSKWITGENIVMDGGLTIGSKK